MNKRIAITVFATKKYSYALNAQIRRLQANIINANIDTGYYVLVGDGNEKIKEAEALFKRLLPNWEVIVVKRDFIEYDNYKEKAQLTIAHGRTEAFSVARSLNVDYTWSLDSDVLPPANALKCMIQMLEFDDGYYGVATCPYISQGGAGLLLGRGTPQHQICPDIYEDEREIPEELLKEREFIGDTIKNIEEQIKTLKPPQDDEKFKELNNLLAENHKKFHENSEKFKQCPPKGNVWELNAKKWRKRGWGDFAYPAIGKGAIVPSDWCGFGCTLLGKKTLSLTHFEGYEGKGTEDLFIIWNRWFPNNIKICSIPHCLCQHVIRKPLQDSEYTLCDTYHETEGECIGHIRTVFKPWYDMDLGKNLEIKRSSKIGIVMAYDENYKDIGDVSSEIMFKYANKYNYDFLLEKDKPKDRHPCWYKFYLIKKHLKNYDWLFWIDSDAWINNFKYDIKNWINDDKYLKIFKEDGGVNTGIFWIKNTEKSFQLIDEILKCEKYHWGKEGAHEQQALVDILKSNLYFNDGIELLNYKENNVIFPEQNRFFPKDFDKEKCFIIHIAGGQVMNGVKEEVIKELTKNVIY